MKVKMKETKKGSPDGIRVIEYQKGKTYDLPEELAEPWVDQDVAAAVRPSKAPEEKVEKPEEAAPKKKGKGKGKNKK